MPQRIETMFGGQPRLLGSQGKMSSIYKAPLAGPWRVTRLGLEGDAQADPENHGGEDMALHHYPRDHYPAWIAETTALAAHLAEAPAFGENISTLGLTEADICIGDSMRVGGVILQVSQGRQPCWKLNAKFHRADVASRVQKSGRTGWYYRVLKEGIIVKGDPFELVDRPHPQWPLSRIIELLYQRTKAYDELAALAELPELAAKWRKLAAQRVGSRSVENWSRRLDGA
jgi:MOSC domain-containing protein YiiM